MAFRANTPVPIISATSVTLTPDGSVQAGDALWALIGVVTGAVAPVWSLPAGWTRDTDAHGEAAAGGAVAAWHIFAAGETSYTFSWGTTGSGGAFLYAASGMNQIAPYACAGSFATGTGTTATATTITPVLDDSTLILAVFAANTTTLTAPDGMTSRGTLGGSKPAILCDQADVIAGATGGRSVTLGTSRAWFALLVSLRDDAYSGTNKFGLLDYTGNLPTGGAGSTPFGRLAELGVRWYRGTTAVDLSDLSDVRLNQLTVRDAGYQSIMVVRWGDAPSSPPSDYAAYRANLRTAIDYYRPAIVVVLNEPNSAIFYSGTASDALAELAAARVVVDAVPANYRPQLALGGIVFAGTMYVCLESLYNTAIGSGLPQDATDCIRYGNVLTTFRNQTAFVTLADVADYLTDDAGINAPGGLVKCRTLFAGAPTSADYTNFHWYGQGGADGRWALETTVSLLTSLYGKPVMSDEIGHQVEWPASNVTDSLASVAKTAINPVVWYSVTTPGGAVSLYDAGGAGTILATGSNYAMVTAGYTPLVLNAPGGDITETVTARDTIAETVTARDALAETLTSLYTIAETTTARDTITETVTELDTT